MNNIGIDIISVNRIEKSLQDPRFLTRVFSEEEQNFLKEKKFAAESAAANFAAKDVDFSKYKGERNIHQATGAGRGYAVAGGVASAIEQCIHAYYPGVEVKIEHAEGLEECKKMLLLAKAGKKNGCLIEGMGCPGGCIAGAGTNVSIDKAAAAVKKLVDGSSKPLPPKDLYEIDLP